MDHPSVNKYPYPTQEKSPMFRKRDLVFALVVVAALAVTACDIFVWRVG